MATQGVVYCWGMKISFPQVSARDGLFGALSMLAVVVTVCIIALTIAIVRQKTHDSSYATRTITVSATGEAYATPDIAEFSFSVHQEGADVAVAQSVSINPKYEWQTDSSPSCARGGYCPGNNVQVGYVIDQTVQIFVRDLGKSGSVYAALGTAKVDNLYGPNFTVEDEDSVKDSAREEAITKARTKALSMARAMGVRLGRVESFSEDGMYPIPMYAGAERATFAVAEDAVALPPVPVLEAGQQKVTSTVSITYRIR